MTFVGPENKNNTTYLLEMSFVFVSLARNLYANIESSLKKSNNYTFIKKAKENKKNCVSKEINDEVKKILKKRQITEEEKINYS